MYFHLCCSKMWCTWQKPPFFLSNLVHIMWDPLKCCFQICLHSSLNCVSSVASFSTFDPGLFSPVLPHPATAHLMRAGVFPFFFGSPMGRTNLFSTAGRFNWEKRSPCNRQSKHHNNTVKKTEWSAVWAISAFPTVWTKTLLLNDQLHLPSAA